VYVRRLQFEDLRCFQTLDFTFEQPSGQYAGWVVITGDNGSGKTALLRALSLCLVGPDVARALEGEARQWIRRGCQRASFGAQVVLDRSLDRFVDSGKAAREPFWAELEIGSGPAATNGSVVLAQAPPERRRARGKRSAARGPWAAASAGWFCAGYGPYRRIYGASQEAARLMTLPGPVGRFVSMFREDAALTEAQLWAKDLEYRRLVQSDGTSHRALAALQSLANDGFLPGGVRMERVDADGLWLADREGVVLPVGEMGDGRRAAMAMLTDMVRHMVEVYGVDDLLETGPDGVPRIARPGVVLIDEIDAHLHPEWQRHLGFWLRDHFPHVQFIVSSHSPLVCPAADEMMVFLLPAPGSGEVPRQVTRREYEAVIRATADDILLGPAYNLRHTRSPRAVAARHRYSELWAKRRAVGLTDAEDAQLKLDLKFTDAPYD